ncbi:MAG: PSP1 domain-containing protein [Patescibacteria group bacterium]
MVFLVEVYSWELPKVYLFDGEIKVGDSVIVATDYGNELGKVTQVSESQEEAPKILRLATERDLEVFRESDRMKKSWMDLCREESRKLSLMIKLVDARMSLDGKQIIFAFTSDGRVDFRELVKNLSRELKKSIRMQQIGSRDEARRFGGVGICGREICCSRFSGSLKSITTEMARQQHLAHRGAERISGLCGRLMCCLAYEWEQYQELLRGMPELYSVISTKNGKGTVMEINVANQEVKIKLESGEYIIVKKEEL